MSRKNFVEKVKMAGALAMSVKDVAQVSAPHGVTEAYLVYRTGNDVTITRITGKFEEAPKLLRDAANIVECTP